MFKSEHKHAYFIYENPSPERPYNLSTFFLGLSAEWAASLFWQDPKEKF